MTLRRFGRAAICTVRGLGRLRRDRAQRDEDDAEADDEMPEFSITLRKSSPSFSFSWLNTYAGDQGTYPGNERSTQGDKNEISPAKMRRAVMANRHISLLSDGEKFAS